MLKTAGVVFDFYDDPNGSLLKKAFPTPQDLPDIIKTAHILTADEREVLRNEAFALVMVNEGKHLRKFACVDAGNTALSAMYFLEHFRSLPSEAIKVACANLIEACEEFGLPTGHLAKVAASHGMSRKRDPMRQSQFVSEDGEWAQRTNILSEKGSDGGKVMTTASTMKTAGIGRELAVNTAANLASTGIIAGGAFAAGRASGKQKKANIVDVTDSEPDVWFAQREVEHSALDGRYPLDSYADVKHAVAYFADSHLEMTPEDRHEYCVKTASRARELGIETSELIDRYGSTEYAYDVDAHLAGRRAICPAEFKPVYNELQEKRAMIEPTQFVELLKEADEAANLHWYWGADISDPYFATFGGNSEKLASEWSWQGRVGDYVNAEQLKNLALNGRPLVHKHFTSDMTNAFCKDPVTIFKSLPDDTKAILARLANDLGKDGLAGN